MNTFCMSVCLIETAYLEGTEVFSVVDPKVLIGFVHKILDELLSGHIYYIPQYKNFER